MQDGSLTGRAEAGKEGQDVVGSVAPDNFRRLQWLSERDADAPIAGQGLSSVHRTVNRLCLYPPPSPVERQTLSPSYATMMACMSLAHSIEEPISTPS
jgi:hypothetical protein